jgi:hypothetical protein
VLRGGACVEGVCVCACGGRVCVEEGGSMCMCVEEEGSMCVCVRGSCGAAITGGSDAAGAAWQEDILAHVSVGECMRVGCDMVCLCVCDCMCVHESCACV